MAKIAFFFSLIFIAYTYIGYPVLLGLFCLFLRPNRVKRDFECGVSVIVAAHNEEMVMQSRIENLLSQGYPEDKMEILVVSDGSIDKTCEIVNGYEDKRVRLLKVDTQMGRAFAHNLAAKEAKNEILVFTDADTRFMPDVIKRLVANFADPSVGCAGGLLIFKDSDNKESQKNESLYRRWDRFLINCEGRLGISHFVPGACSAYRKSLFEFISISSDIDNTLPLKIASNNYRIVLDGEAIAYDKVASTYLQRLRQRVRVVTRSMPDFLGQVTPLLRAKKFAILWSLSSHRLFRWYSSILLVVLLATNIFLLDGIFYRIFFGGQLCLYGSALIGLVLTLLKKNAGVFSAPLNFLIFNTGFVIANINVLFKKKMPIYGETT